MSQTLLRIIADFNTQLASAPSIGATTCTIASATDDDGVALPTGTYGFTIDAGSSSKEYIVATLTSTALTNIVSISRQGTSTTGFVRAHRRGAKVVITDWASIKRISSLLDGTTNFDSATNLGYDGAPTSLTGNQFATVAYVLSVVSGGTVTFDQQVISNQVAGETLTVNQVVYFKESDQRWWLCDADLTTTFDQLQIGITKSAGNAGATIQVAISGPVSGFSSLTAGSKYYLSNTAGAITTTAGTYSVFVGWALTTTILLFNDVAKTLPSQKEKDAMAGSTGTPSSTNKYVTQDSETISSYDQSQTTQNSTIELGEANATTKKNKIAQSFIPTKTKIRGVTLYKTASTGTFTGTVTVAIQEDSTGSPSGSNLASVTLTNVEWGAFVVGANDANFSSEYSMTTGSTYWIVVTTSTSDNSNHPNIGINTAGGYSNGSIKYNNTTDGWVAVSTSDFYFKTLEGNNSQVVMTDTSGDIPLGLFNVAKMPIPRYLQTIAPSASITLTTPEFAAGASQDGSAMYFTVQNTGNLYRFQRDSITGQYIETHSVSISSYTGSGDNGVIIQIGDYIYLFGNNGTNIKCSRFLAADLTGETVMTVPTVAATTLIGGWTDGTYAYLVSNDSDTTSNKWSVSGTTFTAVTTASVTANIFERDNAASMFDGSTAYYFSNSGGTGNCLIQKITTIDGSVYSTTTKNLGTYSDADLGGFIINIDSQTIYIGKLFPIYDEATQIAVRIILFPITKP